MSVKKSGWEIIEISKYFDKIICYPFEGIYASRKIIYDIIRDKAEKKFSEEELNHLTNIIIDSMDEISDVELPITIKTISNIVFDYIDHKNKFS